MLKNILALAAALTLAVHADPTTKPAPENPAPAQPTKKQPTNAQTAVPVKPKAADKAENPAAKVAEKPAEPKKESPADSELEKAKAAQERLAIFNALATEEQKHDTLDLRSDIALLKLEKELLVETLALAAAQKNSKQADAIAKFESEKERLTREVTLAKLRSEHLSSQLKELQATSSLKTSALMAQISEIETSNKREDYVDAEPQYLDNPLKKDGTLVISDRRIPFNGPVTSNLADKVTERINYFNNKDPKKPIFIVIDDSPGGSVMAGYRILKSMEGSEAPVYVVVKSFAASMAATITTLAEKSFVYPNAVILHHQISQSFMFSSMNLTEQKENVDDLMRWWNRLAGPIAEKMGITPDQFIERNSHRQN